MVDYGTLFAAVTLFLTNIGGEEDIRRVDGEYRPVFGLTIIVNVSLFVKITYLEIATIETYNGQVFALHIGRTTKIELFD